MNSLLAVTVSVGPVVDCAHFQVTLKESYDTYTHAQKGWIFKIEYGPISLSGGDVISSHVRYVRSRFSLAQTSRRDSELCVSTWHGQFSLPSGAEVESGSNHQRTRHFMTKDSRQWQSKEGMEKQGRQTQGENGREPARTMKQDLVLRL